MTDALQAQNITLSYLAECLVSTENERVPYSGEQDRRSFIRVIKLFRSITGLGLAEAKDYCDAAVVALQIGTPEEINCSHCDGKGYHVKYNRGW